MKNIKRKNKKKKMKRQKKNQLEVVVQEDQ
jgi:hypothetical protein